MFEGLVPKHQPPVSRQRQTVSRGTRLQHAVKEVDAAQYAFEKAVGTADAHQIPRLVLRHIRADRFEHFVHDRLRLSDG